MCYGEARTGRESCLFGAEEAMLQGNGNATARVVPGASSDEGLALVTLRRLLAASGRLEGHTLHAGGCVLTMELLVDLKNPAAEVKVAESQFAGIHLDGLTWSPLADDAACVALSQQLCSSRQARRPHPAPRVLHASRYRELALALTLTLTLTLTRA